MASVRDRVLQAAVDLLGTQGLKALTHRRIDTAAGVPAGSTSNYFRTRDALLTGVADAILERDLAGLDVETGFAPRSVDDLVDMMVALLDRTTREQRTLTTARLVLFMEGSHHPALRDALSRGRAALQAGLQAVLTDLGASDPPRAVLAVMACSEGLILHRIGRHDEADARPVLDVVIRAAFDEPHRT